MYIDWHRVNELRAEIGDDDFDEVAVLFLDEVASAVSQLEQSVDHSNREADLHFIKGSSQNLGFKALAELCATWEVNARNGQAADVPITEVRRMFDQSCEEYNDKTRGAEDAA